MNNIIKHKATRTSTAPIIKLLSQCIAGLSATVLVGCGSGGNTEPSMNQDFTPNSERLISAASTSGELYVDEAFTFNHSQLTHLAIQTLDTEGAPISYARINIYLLDTELVSQGIELWTDELSNKASLIAGGSSNASGLFERVLEIPKKHSKNPMVLVEVNALGIENKTLISIDSPHTQVTLGPTS